jgi:hypothetical protein
VTLALDVGTAEGLLGVELVVGLAEDAEVFGIVVASERSRFHVVELEEAPRVAATTVGRYVRAAQSVTLEDAATDGVRDPFRAGTHGLPARRGRFSVARRFAWSSARSRSAARSITEARSPVGFA